MEKELLIKSLRWCADNTLCVDLSTGEQCPRFKYREICKQKKQMHEAADAIEADEKRIEELISRVPKWIDANERLPEKSGEHIVFLEGARVWREQDNDVSYVTSMWFDKKQNIWKDMNGDDSYNAVLSAVDTDWACSVTHWMELPEPPKGE